MGFGAHPLACVMVVMIAGWRGGIDVCYAGGGGGGGHDHRTGGKGWGVATSPES